MFPVINPVRCPLCSSADNACIKVRLRVSGVFFLTNADTRQTDAGGFGEDLRRLSLRRAYGKTTGGDKQQQQRDTAVFHRSIPHFR